MVAAVPSIATVVDAIHGVMTGIGSIGTVNKGFHTHEDDVEYLLVAGLLPASSLDVWFIELGGTTDPEGRGRGESYSLYSIHIRFWSMRTANANWSKEAREKAMSVADTLQNHASIFRIGGQVQILTPTTVSLLSHGVATLRDRSRRAGQMIYESILGLTVEARRWS